MKSFEYVIKDEIGIHARPAGLLVKEAKKYESKIILKKDGKTAEATKLMAVMGLGVKCGNKIDTNHKISFYSVLLSLIHHLFYPHK